MKNLNMTGEANQVRSMYDAVRWTMAAILFFVLIEAALFRSGWYLRYLAPQSSAGQVELMHYWLKRSPPAAVPEVLVLGDSRIAEGFSARMANEETQGHIRFHSAGAGGTSPRVWYYLLRDVDTGRNRFRAIVLPLDHYSDHDDVVPYDKRITDLNYAIGRLRVGDCYSFARSFDTPALLLHAVAGCLFRGMMLRDDLNDLLANYTDRMRAARLWRTDGDGFLDGYEGKPEDVNGISVDWTTRRVSFPARLNEVQRSTIQSTVAPPPVVQTGDLTRYRQLWLGAIMSLYAKTATRFIFIELPRAPLPTPDSAVPSYYLDGLRGRADVSIVPRETFRDFERPDLFADGLHLNHTGRPLFSKRLAGQVAGILGGG